MTDSYGAHDSASSGASQTSPGAATDGPVYPEQRVLAIVDTHGATCDALDALSANGFLESEITVLHGPAQAARLDAGTGRTGLLDRVLRFAEKIGVHNDELAVKERYEEALRADQYVVQVFAPSDERKDRAAAVLAAHGGRFVNYFGRLTLERLSA